MRGLHAGPRRKMDMWIFLLGILQVASCLEGFHYEFHGDTVSFEKAREECQHEGHLTTLVTNAEVQAVQEAVFKQDPPKGTHTYWIGLLKRTGTCHNPNKPLKGFTWITGGDDAPDIKWNKEPAETCTNDRCAYLSITYDGTTVKDWGLLSDGCRTEHPFICKVKGEKTTPAPKGCLRPAIRETHDSIIPMGQPSELTITCVQKTYKLTCSDMETLTWTMVDGSAVDFEELCRPCTAGFQKSDTGKCVDINECEKQSCGSESTCVNTVGSYRCEDTSPPQPTQAATPRPEKDPEAHPPHTEGAPVTPRAPEEAAGNFNDTVLVNVTPASPDYSYIYIPVVVAVLALLLLLVLILALVACCRRRKRRRSKSLAGHKATKQSMALRDSMEKVNDK